MSFLTGSPEKHGRVSTLLPEQERNYREQQNAAGGSYGKVSNYYNNLLSDNPADFDSFAAPELRRFNEEIVPGLAEQFAGMGSGGLDSSSFRNAAVNAGESLSERLGALRAQLRQQGAAGLQQQGQNALGNYSQDVVTQQGTEGFLPQAAGAFGAAIGGPVAGAVAGGVGNWLSNSIKSKSNNYDYGKPGVSIGGR